MIVILCSSISSRIDILDEDITILAYIQPGYKIIMNYQLIFNKATRLILVIKLFSSTLDHLQLLVD